MKIGDVIKYDGMWGVVYKIKGSYIGLRIQRLDVIHSDHYIDLLNYYNYNFNVPQYIKYKLYRFFENMWDTDIDDIGIAIILMFGFVGMFILLL